MGIGGEDPTLDEQVAELAKLPPLEYEQVREPRAEAMGVRVSVLDKEVEAKRPKTESDAKGRAIVLTEYEPWPDEVNGSAVLDEVLAHIQRHMVIDEGQAEAVALWIAHCHLFKSFSHSPRLLISAPDAECGKTLLMSHMAGNMVPKPMVVELMKSAPFFRLAEEMQPTYLIDEMDVFIQQDSDLLAAVNNGWEPHGGVPRCVGDDNEVRIFSTHTPVAMAGIELHKKLPAATVSRSIMVMLDRAAGDEISDQDVYNAKRHRKGLHQTARKLTRWCADHRAEIANRDPTLPANVRNRLADKWGPLLAIAEAAGGHWPDKAKAAIFSQPDLSEPSKALQLLIDIRDYMKDDARNIKTVALIHALCSLEDTPWSDYNFRQREPDERRIQPRQLANLLKRYRIKSDSVRIPGEPKTGKGYKGEDLKKAWDRYLPSDTHLEKGEQRNKSTKTGPTGEPKGEHAESSVPHSIGRKGPSDRDCSPVPPSDTPPIEGDTVLAYEEVI